MRPLRLFGLWVGGGVVAFVLLVIIGGQTLDTHMEETWCPELEQVIHTPGSRVVFHKEGGAISCYGKYGISAIADITKVAGARVLIWGDSQVEANQVADDEKTAQQFTRLWQQTSREPLLGVGLGRAAANIADHYFQIPKYEKLIGPVRHHFVVLAGWDRVLPDGRKVWAKFVSKPQLHFVPNWEKAPSAHREHLLHWLSQGRLQVLQDLKVAIWGSTKGGDLPIYKKWRFHPGRAALSLESNEKKEIIPMESLAEENLAFDFVTSQLRKQSPQPITFLYCPTVPSITRGQIIMVDPCAERAKRFALACQKNKIGFVNLADPFIEIWKSKGRLVRGFSNSHPGEGHFNTEGHRVIASAMVKVLQEDQP